VLRRVSGDGVRLVDSAEAVARQVAGELAAGGLAADGGGDPEHHFCVTDSGEHFARVAADLLADSLAPASVSLELVEV